MTNGETQLDILIKTMQPMLHEGVFVFHSSAISFADAVAFDPVLIFKEQEGTAIILKQEHAVQHRLDYVFPSRMITLNVHSSLEAVGFLASITRNLAQGGISTNTVSAHFHDHLFVPQDRAADAMTILNKMVNEEAR